MSDRSPEQARERAEAPRLGYVQVEGFEFVYRQDYAALLAEKERHVAKIAHLHERIRLLSSHITDEFVEWAEEAAAHADTKAEKERLEELARNVVDEHMATFGAVGSFTKMGKLNAALAVDAATFHEKEQA